MNTFDKQPGETYTIAIEFQDKLPAGTALASGTVSGFDIEAVSADNTILASTTCTISGTQARAKVQAGANGQSYKLTFLITLDDDSILEEDIIMRVRGI